MEIIEDPGIPHPGRHTTILGQTLRTNEITPANISELLRIYLYAHATGEVKALTGIVHFIKFNTINTMIDIFYVY